MITVWLSGRCGSGQTPLHHRVKSCKTYMIPERCSGLPTAKNDESPQTMTTRKL
jgi:hypothetical protein